MIIYSSLLHSDIISIRGMFIGHAALQNCIIITLHRRGGEATISVRNDEARREGREGGRGGEEGGGREGKERGPGERGYTSIYCALSTQLQTLILIFLLTQMIRTGTLILA